MKKTLTAIFLLLLFFPNVYATDVWPIHAHGYGAVRVGMSQQDAQKLLGTELFLEESALEGGCFIATPKHGHAGLYLMIAGDKIFHVGTLARGIASDRGIRVGDSASDVKAKYGAAVEVENHKYQENAYYFFVWEKKALYGMEFEIDANGKVVQIRGGDATIQLVEGPCS